jgi:uncharacterized Zn-binding protein involved in type VI secretion
MRYVIIGCTAALSVTLGSALAAQTPTVQNPTIMRPYATTVATPAQQIAALQQAVATLQQQVAALQTKLQLVNGDATNFTIAAPGSITIKAQQQFTVNAAAGGTLNGGATLGLNGTMVLINNGGRPAARVGDIVGSNGVVTTGSATVLIGQ